MLVYCDYIASVIKDRLTELVSRPSLREPTIASVDGVQWDLNEDGSFKSTTKTVSCVIGSQKYKITVEEDNS